MKNNDRKSYEALKKEPAELTEDELNRVTGGVIVNVNDEKRCPLCGQSIKVGVFNRHLLECAKKIATNNAE